MTDTRSLLISALTQHERERPRSRQKMLGPSSLGSCKRQTVYKLMDTEPINDTEILPTLMGTAIHGVIEDALRAAGYTTVEITVPGFEGLLADGHVDFYQPDAHKITDWKTTTKTNLRYFPYPSQIGQVQAYGLMASRDGLRVDEVELVAIPRDGKTTDIVIHTEPYDPEKAYEWLDWMQERKAEAEAGLLPAPEKYAAFCRDYCPFYGDVPGYCLGVGKKLSSRE